LARNLRRPSSLGTHLQRLISNPTPTIGRAKDAKACALLLFAAQLTPSFVMPAPSEGSYSVIFSKPAARRAQVTFSTVRTRGSPMFAPHKKLRLMEKGAQVQWELPEF
jgi:hypothetical protein